MNISIFIKKISGRKGGAEKVAVDLSNICAEYGYDIEIVHYEDSDEKPAFKVSSSIKIHNLKKDKLANFYWAQFFYSLFLLFITGRIKKYIWLKRYGVYMAKIRQYYASRGPVTVVAFLPTAFTYAVEALFDLNDVYVISSNHNVPEKDYYDSTRWDSSEYDREKRRLSIAKADAVTVTLPSFIKFYHQHGAEKVVAVGNMVELPSDKAPSKKFGEQVKKIISIGRFAEVKQMELLIRAFELVLKKHPDWVLVLCGDGPCFAECRRYVGSNALTGSVVMTGFVDDVGSYLNDADFFVIPSKYEGFGLVTIEAFSYGLPVIGFEECPGTNELVVSGDNGLLVSMVEPIISLSNAMVYLIENERERIVMGENAVSAAEEYQPNYIFKNWEDVFNGSRL